MFNSRFIQNCLQSVSILAILHASSFASGFTGEEKSDKKPAAVHLAVNGEGLGVAENNGVIDAREDHRGTGGGAVVHNHLGSPHTERDKRPDEYFAQGESFISKKPPNWEEALEVFLFAANAEVPHAMACVRCAEYYQRQDNSEMGQIYYERSLLAPGIKPPKVYRELMKLYHEIAIGSRRPQMKENNLRKALGYGEQITRLTGDDETMLDDIEAKLSQLGIVISGASIGGSSVGDVSNSFAATTSPVVPDIKRLIEESRRGIKAPREQLMQIAMDNNVEAQLFLGDLHSEGVAIRGDDTEALKWYQLSAELGNPEGQFKVGFMYAQGRGVSKDESEAVRLYRLSSRQGNPDAHYNLAVMYSNGRGISRDESEAERLYDLAASQGHIEALRHQKAREEAARSAAEQKAKEEAARLETERKAKEKSEAAALSAALVVTSPPASITMTAPRISIPAIARGYEAIYERFLRGVLIYKPNKENDVGRVELAISEFLTRGQNPLESTFDLSGCGDAGKYISISTGYRREATKSVNSTKWEVFITPKFLIEAHKATTASHYAAITNASWTAPFAVIQDYGGWSDINWYWYNTSITDQELNTQNLYEIYQSEKCTAAHTRVFRPGTRRITVLSSILVKF